MQPIFSSDVLTPKLSVVVAARDAYFRGDFDACFAALDSANGLASEEQREALLLRARTLLRVLRFDDVVTLLGPVLASFTVVDEACTARMLHAVGVLRSGRKDSIERGMALLAEVQAAAVGLKAHRAIRGEIEYWIAFGHWMLRDFQSTLKHAYVAEAAEADVISVRAASLRGYVAAAKEHYNEALALFRSALEKYRTCRERDADLVERIVVQIAALEVALRSAAVCGTHNLPPDIGTRVAEVQPDRERPGVFRMQIASLDSWLYAFDGDRAAAYRYARLAEHLAPDSAWRLWALANRAQITAAFGDVAVAAEFAADALEIVDTIDWSAANEERTGLLLLSEALAITNPIAAVEVLRRYDELTPDVDRALMMHDDVRLWILETFVRALVHRIRGEHHQAWRGVQGRPRCC